MIYEPSYIYPNVLDAQGERCFYTTRDNTFRILINSDYPIVSCSYTIYNPDRTQTITGTKTLDTPFYTNTITGEQNLLEIDGVSLKVNGKINVGSGVLLEPTVFSDTTWTYELEFTDSMGNTLTTKTYAFYITPSPDFTLISGNSTINITSRSASFTGGFVYSNQPISWIQWIIYNANEQIFTTDKVYRSVATNLYYDGFNSGETYTIEFKACDARGNISSAIQHANVLYNYLDTSTSVTATPQSDTSMLIDWSSFQGITGNADTSVTTTFSYANNIPAADHNSVKLTRGRILFKGSNDVALTIPEDDYITWSGALYGNLNNIIEAVSDTGVTTLSLKEYVAGLYPNTDLYPSNSLYPKDVTNGVFEYKKDDGTIYRWSNWTAGLDVTNSWFIVELSDNSINVYQKRWNKV